MLYSPVKFWLTVVKPYNHDLDSNPAADDSEDIIYAKGPARPSRLEVRIPAATILLVYIISDVIINKD